MKSNLYIALVAGLLALPTVSFAESASVPVTRAEVQADLVRLEQAGYRPRKMSYPADIQAAEARLNAQDVAASNNSGTGGVANGSSQMSAPATTKMGADPLYSHH
ncbi:DUF4148 domain-containing protein [Paraburkholderia aromaticivorans]|uniref:DUF4148 domain-containing protein n=1 Tax=Paraburkholderia aromaticivorans TaxID=2026199 RepID=A0A248VWJ4_9BURK|nr:DUF4148 domain-containing protein [Paraburkholderia aromaticivorans]ASW03245.1 hypothetical protein CJU94_34135 [Paraburkholderia aromaticivorans]